MYNNERKEKYFAECKYKSDTVNKIIRINFNKISEIEEKLNKDVCDFNNKDIEELFKFIDTIAMKRLKTLSAFLFDYREWCSKNELVLEHGGNQFVPENTGKIIEKVMAKKDITGKYYNLKMLLEYFKMIPCVSNRFIFYALYLNISQDDIPCIKLRDINKNNKTIALASGVVANIDDYFIELAEESDREEYYYKDGKDSLTEKDMKTIDRLKYVKSPYILKYVNVATEKNDVLTRRNIVRRMNYAKTQCKNSYFSAANLLKNGLINYIYEYFNKKNITLREAFTTKTVIKTDCYNKVGRFVYAYTDEIAKCIEKFGLKVSVESLRMEINNNYDIWDNQ